MLTNFSLAKRERCQFEHCPLPRQKMDLLSTRTSFNGLLISLILMHQTNRSPLPINDSFVITTHLTRWIISLIKAECLHLILVIFLPFLIVFVNWKSCDETNIIKLFDSNYPTFREFTTLLALRTIIPSTTIGIDAMNQNNCHKKSSNE